MRSLALTPRCSRSRHMPRRMFSRGQGGLPTRTRLSGAGRRLLPAPACLLRAAGLRSPGLCRAGIGAAKGYPVSARAIRAPGRRCRHRLPLGVDSESADSPTARRASAPSTGGIPVTPGYAARALPDRSDLQSRLLASWHRSATPETWARQAATRTLLSEDFLQLADLSVHRRCPPAWLLDFGPLGGRRDGR